MKKSDVLIGSLLVLIGLMMIIIPRWCLKAVVILLGIEAIANGVYNLLYTRKLIPDAAFQFAVLGRGMFSLVIGLLSFFLPLQFADIMWKGMLYVLAFYLLIGAVLQMYTVGKLRDTGIDRNQFILEAVISIIASIIIFLFAVEIGLSIVRIGGLILVVSGASFCYYLWKNQIILEDGVEIMDDITGNLEQ